MEGIKREFPELYREVVGDFDYNAVYDFLKFLQSILYSDGRLTPEILNNMINDITFDEQSGNLYLHDKELPSSAYKAIKYLVNTRLINPKGNKGLLLMVTIMDKVDVIGKLLEDFRKDRTVVLDLLLIIYIYGLGDVLDVVMSEVPPDVFNSALEYIAHMAAPMNLSKRLLFTIIQSDNVPNNIKDGLIIRRAAAGLFDARD